MRTLEGFAMSGGQAISLYIWVLSRFESFGCFARCEYGAEVQLCHDHRYWSTSPKTLISLV